MELVDPYLNQVPVKRLFGFAWTLGADELEHKSANFKELVARLKQAQNTKQAAINEVKDETE